METSSGLISIIIASWNDVAKLRNCLDSLYRSTVSNFEIIVIDNASIDGTPDILRQYYSAVRLHANAANIGHTKAINQGLSLAKAEYVLILDPDTELAPDCLETLQSFLKSRQDVIMVAPRTFNSDGTIQESARNFPGLMSGLFGRQSSLTRLFPNNPFSRKYLARAFIDSTVAFQVEQIGGACMFFRRSLIAKVGPWDERYFGYWVDTDWCQSIRLAGECIYCVPAARITHHESNARGKAKRPSRIWMFHYGVYQYYSKWHCRGYWDPRSVFAGVMLGSRALLHMAWNVIFGLILEMRSNKTEAARNEIDAKAKARQSEVR